MQALIEVSIDLGQDCRPDITDRVFLEYMTGNIYVIGPIFS